MRTARSLPYGLSLTETHPGQRPPLDRDPPGQRPPYQDRPPTKTDPLPRQTPPPRNMGPATETPWKEHETRQPDMKWHHTENPSTCEQNDWHACENITLPQTSFAGGKNVVEKIFTSCATNPTSDSLRDRNWLVRWGNHLISRVKCKQSSPHPSSISKFRTVEFVLLSGSEVRAVFYWPLAYRMCKKCNNIEAGLPCIWKYRWSYPSIQSKKSKRTGFSYASRW